MAGKRLKRVEEDKTTRFYYMGEALLFTTNQDLVMTSENVVNTGGQIIASKRFAVPGVEAADPFAGQYYFYRYDVRGSVTDVLDKNAGLVKGYDYDEFGNTEEKGNESFLNDVTFTGSVSDASSGLQYMNARFYQPSTGRFLSQDSYSGNPYDPWTQHLYSYCGNNPVNMIDPTGFAASRFAGFGNDPTTTSGLRTGKIDGRGNEAFISHSYTSKQEKVSTGKSGQEIGTYATGATGSYNGGSLMKHNAVVAALAAKTGGYPEVYVLGGAASGRVDTYGRIDVATKVDANYCVADGAIIYEVKPASSYGFRTGRKQLVRYQKAATKNGIMVEIADTDPALGIVAAPDGSLLYTTFSGGVIYYCDISYDPQPILASEPKAVTEEDYAPVPVKDVVAGVVTATALIVIAYFTGGLGAMAVA